MAAQASRELGPDAWRRRMVLDREAAVNRGDVAAVRDVDTALALLDAGKLEPFAGYSVAISGDRMVAASRMAAFALREGVARSGDPGVYVLHLDA